MGSEMCIRDRSCPVCNVDVLWSKRFVGSKLNLACRQSRPWPRCVRWGPSPAPPKGQSRPNFRPMSVVAKRLDGLRCHLVWRQASAQATLCWMGTQLPLSPKREQSPQFSAHVYCGQTAGWIKMPLGITEVSIGPGHIVLDGHPAAPPKKGAQPSKFSAHVCCGQTA